jgi:hypothetical protein
MSVGPSLAGVFQQMNQGAVPGVAGSFPTPIAYSLIFITAAAVSLGSAAMALSLTRRRIAIPNAAGDARETGKESY